MRSVHWHPSSFFSGEPCPTNGTTHGDRTHPHPVGLFPQRTVLIKIRRRMLAELCPHSLHVLRANQRGATRAGCGIKGSGGCLATNVALHTRERDVESSS